MVQILLFRHEIKTTPYLVFYIFFPKVGSIYPIKTFIPQMMASYIQYFWQFLTIFENFDNFAKLDFDEFFKIIFALKVATLRAKLFWKTHQNPTWQNCQNFQKLSKLSKILDIWCHHLGDECFYWIYAANFWKKYGHGGHSDDWLGGGQHCQRVGGWKVLWDWILIPPT